MRPRRPAPRQPLASALLSAVLLLAGCGHGSPKAVKPTRPSSSPPGASTVSPTAVSPVPGGASATAASPLGATPSTKAPASATHSTASAAARTSSPSAPGGAGGRPAAPAQPAAAPGQPSPGSHAGQGAGGGAPAQSPPPSPTSAPPPPTGAFATTVALASTAGPSAAGTQVQASASCPAGSTLVAGGFNLRTTDGTVPNNSLRALAAVPSTAAGVPVSSGPPAAWLSVGGAGGQPMSNAQTDGYALCATGAAVQPQVAVASVAGPAVAAGSVAATANCPAGDVLVGGGASTSVPASSFQPSLHLIGSYPSNAAGAAAANGAAPTSWTAVAASGGAAITGATTSAYAVCAPAGVVSVQVATVTANGPQTASTPQQLTVHCPAGSAVLGGGVNITLNGGTPQQGVHVTGDYPSVGAAPVAAGGTATDWTAITQSGGQPTPGTISSGFALCGVRA